MLRWIKYLVLFAIAIAAAIFLRQTTGEFVVTLGDTRLTVNFAVGVVILVIAFILLFFVFKFLGGLLHLPNSFKDWRKARQVKNDYGLIEKSWVSSLDGDYQSAQHNLLKLAYKTKDAERQAVALLIGARFAIDNAKYDQAKDLLNQANAITKDNSKMKNVVQTTRGSMLLEQGQVEEALAILEPMLLAKNDSVQLRQLVFRCYKQLNQYDKTIRMADNLYKNGLIGEAEYLKVTEQNASTMITMASADEWEKSYKQLSHKVAHMPLVVLSSSARYKIEGNEAQATKILEKALDKSIDTRMLAAYVQMASVEQVPSHLAKVQKWLESNPNNPDIYNALGLLCIKGQLWGQADHHLQKSLSLRDDAKVHSLLAMLADRLNKVDESLKHWRLASGDIGILSSDYSKSRVVLPAADTTSDPDGPPDRKKLGE